MTLYADRNSGSIILLRYINDKKRKRRQTRRKEMYFMIQSVGRVSQLRDDGRGIRSDAVPEME